MESRPIASGGLRPVVVVVLLALVSPACGGVVEDAAGDVAAESAGPFALADATSTTVAETTTVAPTSSTTTTTTTTIPPDPFRTWVATAHDDVVQLVAYDEPDGVPLTLPFVVPNPHQFGGPLTLMVVHGQPGDEWLRVQLPIRPNGQEGWVRAAEYEIGQTRVRAEVDLSERYVAVYDGDDLIAETEAVVGAESTPTPLGTFYVAAKRRNPEEEYYVGPWALVLSGFSEALETFSGGLPVIAIHGTHRPEQVGQSRSNGCIRVPNEVIEFLAEHVPIGAPVVVSA